MADNYENMKDDNMEDLTFYLGNANVNFEILSRIKKGLCH